MTFSIEEILAFFRRFEYDRRECIVIERSKDKFGRLLNMAAGYPLAVNDITFRTLEHLYQCLRFPMHPRLQKRIIEKPSPLVAKWVAKPHRKDGRADWFEVKFSMMWWCLHVKLAQHYDAFGTLLDGTGKKTILETSPDGDLWGGMPSRVKSKPNILVGSNAFGKMLTLLREEYRAKPKKQFMAVEPLAIDDFLLLGKRIERVVGV